MKSFPRNGLSLARLGALGVVVCLGMWVAAAGAQTTRLGPAIILPDGDPQWRAAPSLAPQFTPGVQGGVDGFVVNTQDRTDVLVFYHLIYKASEGFEDRINWTGDLGTCNAGDIDAVFREDTRRRINYFRAMAGLPADIVFTATKNAKAQEAALIMAANQTLSHFPINELPGGSCLSADGDEAAGKSNLALGNYGAGAVDAYINDFGANNAVVGHRRWILYPPAKEMGDGSIPPVGNNSPANAIWVIGDFGTRPAEPEFVSWPPPGYVPFSLVYPRWSFSLNGATFGSTTVTMTSGGQPVNLFIESFGSGAGDNTIVWQPNGFPVTELAADKTYTVTLSNVMVGGSPRTFTYDVTLMDPDNLNQPITLQGPASPFIGTANTYTYNTVDQATHYELRATKSVSGTWTEGAEASPAPQIIDGTTGGYSVTTTALSRTGSRSFHLAFAGFGDNDQKVTVDRVVLPNASSEFQFFSRYRFVTSDSRLFAEVSTDGGSSWMVLGSRAPAADILNSANWEGTWVPSAFSLSAFAGQTVMVRVRFSFSGSIVTGTDTNVGVFVEDMTVANSDELVAPQLTEVDGSATEVTFNPAGAGQYYLQVQAEVGGRYFGFGPPLIVNASQAAPASLSIASVSVVGGNMLQVDFDAMNAPNEGFELHLAPAPTGVYSADNMAQLQTLMTGTKYRFTTPLQGNQGFFKVALPPGF